MCENLYEYLGVLMRVSKRGTDIPKMDSLNLRSVDGHLAVPRTLVAHARTHAEEEKLITQYARTCGN